MARPDKLPDIVITNTAETPAAAHLPPQLPATPDAPPEAAPPAPPDISFTDHAEQILLGVPGHLPDWLVG